MPELHHTTEPSQAAPVDAQGTGIGLIPAYWVVVAITALCVYIYAPVRHYGFLISWDDPMFYAANPVISRGLSWQGLWWALTQGYFFSWHPATWVSHMLDVELFGLNPGPPHVVNLVIHIINSLLLFDLLRKMTGAVGRSAFVALMFAVHPMHVESVAWLAERKDMLSGLFAFLTLYAYGWYAKEPRWPRYLIVTLLFALGLMSKPMLVTLPFVLLLLDAWPLRRIEWSTHSYLPTGAVPRSRIRSLLLEKLPWLLLSAASSVITYIIQKNGGAIGGLVPVSFRARFANALVAYVRYMGKLFWPAGLAPLYPFPISMQTVLALAAGLILLLITYVAVRSARRYPYIAVGWFWYVGMLLPVIGLVQVGSQSMADRYTYLPSIGLFVITAWGMGDLAAHLRMRRYIPVAFACAAVVASSLLARRQVDYWKSDRTLWERALAVTKDNYVAENNLGIVLTQETQFPQAIAHFEAALRIQPVYADAYNNLGFTLAQQGRYAEAVPLYMESLRIRPGYNGSRVNLATALAQTGRNREAIDQFSQAVELDPELAEAHNGLANSLVREGMISDAITHYFEALRIRPEYAEAHNNLGIALSSVGRTDEAIQQLQLALRGMPNLAALHYRLAKLLEQRGRLPEASEHYETALRLDPTHTAARQPIERLHLPARTPQ